MPDLTTSKSTSQKTCDPAAVHQVFKWIIAGHSEHDVRDAIGEAWPKADPQPLIVAAIQRLADAGEYDAALVRGWCLEATRDLYRRMVEIGDFAGALRAVRDFSRFSQTPP